MAEKKTTLINDQINATEVRLVDADGSQVGVVNITEALATASTQGLDLVLVSENANPPVCKIMDFGKVLYDSKKKAKAARAKQTVVQLKEIQLRPVTDTGDLIRKVNDAKKFLKKGNRVRFSMRFRGREKTHAEIGMNMMNQILTDLGEIVIEKPPVLNGNQILMIVAP